MGGWEGEGGRERARGDVARPTDLHLSRKTGKKKEKKRLSSDIKSKDLSKIQENPGGSRRTTPVLSRRPCSVLPVTFLLMPNKSSVVWGSERKQGDGCVESIFAITLESAGATVLLNGPVREVSHY